MYIHLNWAQSLDGRIAGPGGAPVALSGQEDWQRVHRLRQDLDAICVGSGTVLSDDPSLLVKGEYLGNQAGEIPGLSHPLRVILDRRGRVRASARVLTGPGQARWYTRVEVDHPARVAWDGDLETLVADLAANGIGSMLVEGGATVAGIFLAAGLIDVATVYVSPRILGGDAPTACPVVPAGGLRLVSATTLGEGALLELRKG